MSWTNERVEQLKKLWEEGLSATQIAIQIGGVSRNSVIGKVHRLKLAGRGRGRKQSPKVAPEKSKPKSVPPDAYKPILKRALVAEVPQVQESKPPVMEPASIETYRLFSNSVVPASRHLDLHKLTERTCKWPEGDPQTESFSFCGNDSGDTGPYCSYHTRLAYQPRGERRRMR